MAVGVKYESYAAVINTTANEATDQFTLVLSNTAPDAANDDALADAAEIAAGNGYPAGGENITTTSYTEAGGVGKLVLADCTITATGGSIGPFRYAIVRNATINRLKQYYDRGASITLNAGDQVVLNFDPTTGAATIS